MFSSIGWFEIFIVLIVGLIVVGPERLPGVIEDVRAAIYAARKAINNAKKELNGEFAEEFEQFREPINQIASMRRMGPRAALTKALLDGDEHYFDDFDPRKMMEQPPRTAAGSQGQRAPRPSQQGNAAASQSETQPAQPTQSAPQQPGQSGQQGQHPPQQTQQRGSFSWDDIT